MMKLYYLNSEKLGYDIFTSMETLMEEHRRSRLIRTKDKMTKKELICTDAMFKYAVSKETSISPRSIVCGYKSSGEPYVVGIPLSVSISHSCGRILIGISNSKIGVDIELIRGVDYERLSERYFTDREKELVSLSNDKVRMFLSVWTAKEACFKYSNEIFKSPLMTDTSKENIPVSFEYDGCIITGFGEEKGEFYEVTESDLTACLSLCE